MKRFFAALLLFVCTAVAHAQFSPNTVLTAAALNSALANPAITGGSINGNTSITTSGPVTLTGTNSLGALTSATTQNYQTNSTLLATTAFAKQAVQVAMATIPMTVTSGVYNFAPIGTGAIFGVTTSGGTIASISSIVAGGTGYQVGDCLVILGGNGDALAYVSSVSSGVVTAASVLYGGSGYSGSPQLTGIGIQPGSRSRNLTGTLTGNVTIIIPNGTYLAASRRLGIQNNTTGAFTVTVKLSNGAGGSMGTGVVIPQGSANSTSIMLFTDGVNDVWPEVSSAPNFIIPGALTLQGVNVKPNLTGTTGSLGGSSVGSGACATTTVTITGAATGMAVTATPTTYPGDTFNWRGYVSSANTVTVGVCNPGNGGATPTASIYNVRVLQ